MSERIAYSPDEFAEALGISHKTIYTYLGAGLIRSPKLGRRRFIPASEADRLADELTA